MTTPVYSVEEYMQYMGTVTKIKNTIGVFRFALGDICTKTISSILANRLTKHLVKFGIDEQCGSLFGNGCADATFTLKSALQKLREHQQEAHFLCVDLVKAYDSVNREPLWKIRGDKEEVYTNYRQEGFPVLYCTHDCRQSLSFLVTTDLQDELAILRK